MLKTRIIYLLFSALAVQCALPDQHERKQSESENNLTKKVSMNDTWVDESNGLTARVWTDKVLFHLGEEIKVHYEVKNITNDTINTWHSGFWPNHKIILLDDQGIAVTTTELGTSYTMAFTPGGERQKNVKWPIAPGAKDTTFTSYNLVDLFAIDIPGKYTVQYLYEEYQGEWEGKLFSNQLTIEIIE